MVTFSTDPTVAEEQMQAIVFYLTTFGYIDGDFDDSEKEFVREYINRLVRKRIEDGMPDADAETKVELAAKFTTHFHEVFEGIDEQVRELFTEAVAMDEEQDNFIHAKLKLRCFEIFQGFERDNQAMLVEAMDELIEADGHVHPAEAKFRDELLRLFENKEVVEFDLIADESRVVIGGDVERSGSMVHHPFFEQFEHHYSTDEETINKQVGGDIALIDKVIETLAEQRAKGAGKLKGHQRVTDFKGEAPFLDGHVWVHPVDDEREYDLTILGDLHGCYSCLKGAVMQSDFLQKVSAYKAAPDEQPKPLLVLLGDYIDRGMYSLNGVLRAVMQTFVTAPEHVIVLRGNHEYYVEFKGKVYGGVKPAEAINTLRDHVEEGVFRRYIDLFEALPTMCFFGKTLFVHGGIPRDRNLREKWTDLETLNDSELRFEMLWSDPSSVDVIPAELQAQSARFPFGKLQARAFLQRVGCNTIIRGHEKVNDGFQQIYNEDGLTLCTLFSAGGIDNDDLPLNSSYRQVTPKALSMRVEQGETTLTPWNINYETYNDPEHNAFFRNAPEIELKKG